MCKFYRIIIKEGFAYLPCRLRNIINILLPRINHFPDFYVICSIALFCFIIFKCILKGILLSFRRKIVSIDNYVKDYGSVFTVRWRILGDCWTETGFSFPEGLHVTVPRNYSIFTRSIISPAKQSCLEMVWNRLASDIWEKYCQRVWTAC